MLDVAAAVLDRVLEVIGANGIPVSIVLVLVAVLLYSRKAMLVGSLVADWTSKMMFGVGLLLILLITGIVTGVNVDRAFQIAATVLDWASSLLSGVVV